MRAAFMLIISISIFVSAPWAVKILYGQQFMQTADVLRWMAFVPFVASLTNIFGVQIMLPLGMKKQFSWILLSSGLLNVAMLAILATLFSAPGAAAAVLVTESAVAVTMAYTLYSKGVVRAVSSANAGAVPGQ